MAMVALNIAIALMLTANLSCVVWEFRIFNCKSGSVWGRSHAKMLQEGLQEGNLSSSLFAEERELEFLQKDHSLLEGWDTTNLRP